MCMRCNVLHIVDFLHTQRIQFMYVAHKLTDGSICLSQIYLHLYISNKMLQRVLLTTKEHRLFLDIFIHTSGPLIYSKMKYLSNY